MPVLLHDKVQLAVSSLVRGVFRLQERVLGQAPSRSLQAGQWFRLSFRAFTTQQSLLHVTAQARGLANGSVVRYLCSMGKQPAEDSGARWQPVAPR